MEFQSFIFLADVTESVDMALFIEKSKGAEEDDYGRAQFLVECAAGQRVHIDHGLVVAAAVGEFLVAVVPYLHFDVVYGVVAFDVDVKADALAVVFEFEGFFFFEVVDVLDPDVKDLFDKAFTKTLVPHYQFEHVVISDGKLFPRLDYVTRHIGHSSLILYHERW